MTMGQVLDSRNSELTKSDVENPARAAATCMLEFLCLSTLVDQHLKGEDMTEALGRLLEAQERKRLWGITQAQMRVALRHRNVEGMRDALSDLRRLART